jgi:hypothetical protein
MSTEKIKKDKVEIVLPLVIKLLGLDKYKLTHEQKCRCIELFNYKGKAAMIKQANEYINQIKQTT